MFKSQRLTFEELSRCLREYEKKYGYSTIEFYRRLTDGELGDDDDLLMWAGLYHLYLTSLPVRQMRQGLATVWALMSKKSAPERLHTRYANRVMESPIRRQPPVSCFPVVSYMAYRPSTFVSAIIWATFSLQRILFELGDQSRAENPGLERR